MCSITLSASLGVGNEGNVEVAGKEIVFTIGSQFTGTVTDASGSAQVTLLIKNRERILLM